MNRLMSTVRSNNSNLSYIWLPSSVCLTVRVRYITTKSNSLSADITFCHIYNHSFRINLISSPISTMPQYRNIFGWAQNFVRKNILSDLTPPNLTAFLNNSHSELLYHIEN